MILSCQKWLPQNAILDGKLERKFQDVVDRWAVKWFSNFESLSASLVSDMGAGYTPESSIVWNNEVENITVVLKASDITIFAENLLNQDFSQNINTADELLFESLSKECVEDFQNSLCKEFLLDSEFSCSQDKILPSSIDQADYFLRIKDDNSSVEIIVTLPKGLLAAARKVNLGPDISDHVLGEIEDAISKHFVSLGARVGTSTINLLDIENLSKGDVIVLENDITEPIDVTVNRSVIAGMKCHVQQDTKSDNLKITQIMMDEV